MKIINGVQRRVRPKVKVDVCEENDYIELVNSENNVVKFKVKNQHWQVLKNEVLISGIELCSRL